MLPQAPNTALPEIIRVKAQKGFYAPLDGKLELVNPGDVVEIPRALAFEMRAAGKAYMVNDPIKRQKDYKPAYATAAGGADPVARQMAMMAESLAALTKIVSGLNAGKPEQTAKV